MRPIYLDTAASTSVDSEVLKAMQPYFSEQYGNPGSMHSLGLEAARALNSSRKKIAQILSCKPEEIIFTGTGTESINLAIKGLADRKKKGHIISTKIEHHAVLDTLEYLEEQGFQITCVDVEPNGIVNTKKIEQAVRKDTFLITVMYANNEIGTVQPIKEIAKIAKARDIVFHTDACQAANSETLNINTLGADMMSLNSSKVYGPKGVGCLYKKSGVRINPLIHGGGQEFSLRSGTENIPLIVGFAKALELADKNKETYKKNLANLRDCLIENLLKIPDTMLNGDKDKRLPNNANITFLNIEGEAILLMLDKEGICASSGSACTSSSLDPSHVILALGRPYEAAHGSIRFTLSKYTTKKDIDKVIKIMPKIVSDLRKMSPVALTMGEIQNV